MPIPSATTQLIRNADWPIAVDIFDTTLRDGSQQEGLSLSVDDKLRIATQLDVLGVTYIEGGWPGSNPKDIEFFNRAATELDLTTATLVAFGSTRKANTPADQDPTLANLLAANTEVVCLVAKGSATHVTETLHTDLEEALAMVSDSVSFLVGHGRRVFVDAEHFFFGYKENPEFAISVLTAAASAGAEVVVLCDTTGGTLPDELERIVADVVAAVDCQVGIHCHNDTGCAVANSLAAVRAGATQVQGCINGYGERVGNADLVSVICDLTLKMGIATIPPSQLQRITSVAHHIAELVNLAPNPSQPYVGTSAFAHKAGLHASAIARRPDAYEHISPELVGNGGRFVVSEMAGRATLAAYAADLGLTPTAQQLTELLDQLKDLEHQGYHFEVADASLELLLRATIGREPDFFELLDYTVSSSHASPDSATASVILVIGQSRVSSTATGKGPVNALDKALRSALLPHFRTLNQIHLVDYRVRVLNTVSATESVTRVLIDTTDGNRVWTTIGVSENIIEASWQALRDSMVFALIHAPD